MARKGRCGSPRMLGIGRAELLALLAIVSFGGLPSQAHAAAPQIATDGASATGPTTAWVDGNGDANGTPTTLHADYALTSEPWCTTEGAEGAPEHSPAQSLGEGQVMISEIIVQLTGLVPGSEYCAELVAENADGVSRGGQRRFTTLEVPSVQEESTTNVTATGATLQAEVDLHGIATGAYYQFQVVLNASEYASEMLCPTASPGFSVCAGTPTPGALPIGYLPGSTAQPSALAHASLDLASAGVALQPGTTYHYRLLVARRVPSEDVLEWEPPVVYGPDQTFITSTVQSPGASTPPGEPSSSAPGSSPPPVPVTNYGSLATKTSHAAHRKHRHKRHHHRKHKHHRAHMRKHHAAHRHRG